jgi:hypothetical protein
MMSEAPSSVLSNKVVDGFDACTEALVGAQSEIATLRAGQHEIRLHTQLTRERLVKMQTQLQPPAASAPSHSGAPLGTTRSASSLESSGTTFASSTAHLAGSGDIFAADGAASPKGFVPGSTPRMGGSKASPVAASPPPNPSACAADPFPHLSNPRPIAELVEVVMPRYIFKLANMKRGMAVMQASLADAKKEAMEIRASSGLPPRGTE